MTAADLRPFPWRHTHGATMTDSESSDVAVVVYREDEAWDVDLLPPALTEDLAGLIQVLRQQPSIGGTIGLAAVGDDFFVAIRVAGGQASVFLSDLTAAVDWPLARQVEVGHHLAGQRPVHGGGELGQEHRGLPAGDLSIFADLGLDEMDLGMIAGNLDLFPDEALALIARKLGFGQAFDRAV